MPHKHWNDIVGWMIVDCLHKQIEIVMKTTIQATQYLSITCDKMTTIDTQSWINIHAYVV
jgi:hypothetical protein